VKQTLTKSCEEDIIVGMKLRIIRVILDNDQTKYSNNMGKRSQNSISRAKEKEPYNLESLPRLVKSLSNEIEEIILRSSKTTLSNKPPRFNLFRKIATSSS